LQIKEQSLTKVLSDYQFLFVRQLRSYVAGIVISFQDKPVSEPLEIAGRS
jgi:hypothetical protein